LVGREGEGLEVLLERLLGGAQALLVEQTGLTQQGHALVGIHHVAQTHLVDRHELARIVRGLVDGRERLGRLQVVRVDLQHLFIGASGPIGLLLLVGPQARGTEEERDALFLRDGGVVGFTLDETDELVPLLGGRVELFELVPRLECDVLLLEGFLRATICGIDREQALERADGAVVVVRLVGVDRPELREVGLEFRLVGRRLREGLERLGELLPLLRALVEQHERVEGAAVRGLVLEHALPELDRDLVLAELRAGDLRHVGVLRCALARREHLGLALHDADEALPVAALLVHLAEIAERVDVVGREFEHLLVALDRFGLVARLRDVVLAGLLEQLDLRGGLTNDRDLRQHRLDHVGPALLALELRDGGVELRELRELRSRQLERNGRSVRHDLRFGRRRFFSLSRGR
jgi:hypothetical protein